MKNMRRLHFTQNISNSVYYWPIVFANEGWLVRVSYAFRLYVTGANDCNAAAYIRTSQPNPGVPDTYLWDNDPGSDKVLSCFLIGNMGQGTGAVTPYSICDNFVDEIGVRISKHRTIWVCVTEFNNMGTLQGSICVDLAE